MAGVGKFKLTDALPKNVAETAGDANAAAGPPVKGKFKAKERSKKADHGQGLGHARAGCRAASRGPRELKGQERRGLGSRPHGRYRPGQPASRPSEGQVRNAGGCAAAPSHG